MNWRAARPELAVAGVATVAAGVAAGAVAGWPGVAIVAAAAAVLALLLLRVLVPASAGQPLRRAREKQSARAITGYGQRRFVVETSLTSGQVYEGELRPVLEHVLAARLAERHAVNLYTDPAAARAVFCRTRRDEELWPLIDPGQRLGDDERARKPHGIPSRTLARLITRMEQL